MADLPHALAEAARNLEAVSDTPRLDAELLMAHALEIDRSALLLRMRELAVPSGFAGLIKRRLGHEPVAYITGQQEFWDLALRVTPDVLIPRADSETLIEAAKGRNVQSILDLGTGSGALLLAALSLYPEASGVGIDASAKAIAVAQANANSLGFADRARFMAASWRVDGWQTGIGPYDLILCNPPYVENGADLAPQVHDYEPHSALYAGNDGLAEYRILIPQIPALLAPGGMAIFELGQGQAGAVSNLAANAGLSCAWHKNLAGIVRALALTA